jgi:hypothetical protein
MPRRGRDPAHFVSQAATGLRPGDNAWIYGAWPAEQREAQDAAFRSAMERAIAAGEEHCATQVSTAPGTRCPITNYRRD